MELILGDVEGFVRAALGYFLILFVPGYATSWALYPGKRELQYSVRIAYSIILSIALTIITLLVLDILFGLDTTASNIILFLLAITFAMLDLWIIQRISHRFRFSRWLSYLQEMWLIKRSSERLRPIGSFIITHIPGGETLFRRDGREQDISREDYSPPFDQSETRRQNRRKEDTSDQRLIVGIDDDLFED